MQHSNSNIQVNVMPSQPEAKRMLTCIGADGIEGTSQPPPPHTRNIATHPEDLQTNNSEYVGLVCCDYRS
jgi:hypothetical protein